ncbi:aminotransferase family protein [Rhodomicrobium lacus]|uniref:aminotransferase family protein n=1 Tax=Rhodomicrobium lacus TaxID=2498452 RepID=UPI0026E38DF1|nr:aspartate aminotransferase family protein [Rhodomicrobium lacus]WKW52140.1 aspartate aminotransferase family protein [Rhodomicrobium lacus]
MSESARKRPATAAAWVGADRLHLLHPQHHPSEQQSPIIWSRGEGSTLYDTEGRAYLDGLSGMWNVHLGHGRWELVEAASRQLSTLAFATAYSGATHEPAIRLAEQLRKIAPAGIEAFFFTTSGSEATDTAIRTARWFWRKEGKPAKTKIIAREWSYHGSTIGAASATGVEEFTAGFGPRERGFVHIPSPYPYRFDGDGDAAADLLEAAILREGPETVAAFIAEPVQGGGGGVIVPPDGYFERIREICSRHDVLFIADEVITGFGRTGRWFALEHWGLAPDIVQFAKGITSGYVPLGGIGVSARIKDALDTAEPDQRWWHGFTASAHPVACAVALETLRIIDEERLVERAAGQGGALLGRLREALGWHPHVGEVRGLGLLAGVELVADRRTRARFAPEFNLASRLRAELLARGLYTRIVNDTICLAPPLTITDTDLSRIADIVVDAVEKVCRPKKP